MGSSISQKLSAALLAFLIAQPGSVLNARSSTPSRQDEVSNDAIKKNRDESRDLDKDHDRDEVRQHDGDNSEERHEELSLREKIELLRHKVKYVFVIFHENESFDHYFGTFPGANGLFSAPRGATPANEMTGANDELALNQEGIGSEEVLTPGITDLVGAFSLERLRGDVEPLSPDYVRVPERLIMHLPPATGYGCEVLGIVPTDKALG